MGMCSSHTRFLVQNSRLTWAFDKGSRHTPIDTRSCEFNRLPEETGTVVIDVNPSNNLGEFSQSSTEDNGPSSIVLRFLQKNLQNGHRLVKLLLPSRSGYVAQSDFLERRMVDCLNVIEVKSFTTPGQRIEACATGSYESMGLSDLLSYCYGAIIVEIEDSSSATNESEQVNEELVKRLSFTWLLPNPISRKRLAFVGGASPAKLEGFAIAAASLNIALVVFDEPGHWISSDEFAHLREKFVPLDMTADANMAHRVAAALSQYQSNNLDKTRLDGIITVDEHLLTIISEAAALLGFNTSPPKSVGLAQNKFQTRQLDSNVYCRLVSSMADLEKLLTEDGPLLQYPLIVKPSKGWSSEGVWKVSNEQELRTKVPTLWQDAFTAWHGRDVVIETYVDGPEVDANMVLVDGEVVFFEVNDDFPSPGDDDYAEKDKNLASTRVANFVETSNMLPSALPACEIDALQHRLHELALAAGFRDGVLHMEAKLRNSTCHYTMDSDLPDSDGLRDLKPKTSEPSKMRPEDVFLLEINPRQPGWQEIEATAHAYGVSYYSLPLLHALADKERILALSQPYLGGAQYHMQLMFVSALKGGVYKSGDICATVLNSDQGQRLNAHVVKCANLMDEGQIVPDPSTGMVYGNFIAYFLIVSRQSRREALRIGHEVENLVRIHTDNF